MRQAHKGVIMKSIISLLIVGLMAGCASLPFTSPPLTPAEAVCKLANEEVERAEEESNKSAPDMHFEMEVEACGMIENTGMGYAIFHINGYKMPANMYMGHMKRMSLYVEQSGKWINAQEGTLVFLPPPNQPEPPRQDGISL